MEVISIGTAQSSSAVRADLRHELGLLHGQGLAIRLLEADRGLYSFLDCQFEEAAAGNREGQGRLLRYYVANVITDLILNVVTREMLKRLLRGGYACFTEEERGDILREAVAILEEPEEPGGLPVRISRRDRILARVLRYLEDHDQLILEGFVRFQLKDYYAELKEVVDRSVDRFMIRREYDEFIRLLRYFVEIQPPRIEELNVRIDGDGFFTLIDEEGRPVEHEQLQSVIAEAGGEEIDREDLLLSALVTIAPARVILHVQEPLALVETIGRVFGHRMLICPGCPLCPGARTP
ncbi:MAG: putative sporulation protein YtxC [Firmicutes bacterium]|nr:putative sporulation protein YtxC [Bacillota bacterium]